MTTYIEGRGTRPEAHVPPGTPTATVPARSGRNTLCWIVAIVIVVLAITYLGALFGQG